MLESLGLGSQGGVEQFLLHPTGSIDADRDLIVYFVQDARCGGQDGGTTRLQILNQKLCVASEESNGGSCQQYLRLNDPLKDVREGQVRQMAVEGLGLDEVLHGPDGAQQILVR